MQPSVITQNGKIILIIFIIVLTISCFFAYFTIAGNLKDINKNLEEVKNILNQ